MCSPEVRILLVDDHPIVREGLALRLRQRASFAVCGEAATVAEARRIAAAERPDFAVIDLVLKDGSGLVLIRDLLSRDANLRILAMSMHDERLFAPRALAAGAHGYVMKDELTDKLLDAIDQVLAGRTYVSDAVNSQIVDTLVGRKGARGEQPLDRLSDRELEVFLLLGRGLSTREIANQLHLSIKTIETYYQRIKTILGVSSRDEILRQAVLWVNMLLE